MEFLNSSATGEGSCGSGRGTWSQRGLHAASQPGEKRSPGWKCPKIMCICQRLGVGKEGWHGAWACAGLEEMSWAKVLAAGPRQHAGLVCCEFPQTSGKFGMSWEVVIFPAQVGCMLFPSREVFAVWAAGAVCLGQPASSLAAGSFGGEMERAMETKLLSPFLCLLLHPVSPFHAVPTGQISTSLPSLRLPTWHLSPWLNTL